MAKRRGTLLNPSGYTPAQVRKLHRAGFNVRGYIPGAPDAIQPRLGSYLKKQATSTINSAYAGAEQAITDRTARSQAIMDKRQRDNEAFQNWLVTQGQSLQSEAASRNAQLLATVQQHQQDTKNAMLEVTQAAQTNLAAQHVAGTLDAGGVVSGAQQATIESGAAKATALTEGTARSQNLLAANQANALAFAKAQEAKDFAKSLQDLADVADSGTKLKLQKGADMAKEMSHLLDQEISKAQQNQQLQIAGQKLGVQMAGIKSTAANNTRTNATARHGQQLTFQAAQNRIMQQNDSLSETQRHNRAMEKNNRDKLKQSGDTGGASKAERADRTKAIRATNRMKSYMQDSLGNGHGKNAFKGGAAGRDDFNRVVEVLRTRYPNDADLILVAYDLWRFGKLRGDSKNRWKNEYGYQLPGGW
jgi:hypothetical protein